MVNTRHVSYPTLASQPSYSFNEVRPQAMDARYQDFPPNTHAPDPLPWPGLRVEDDRQPEWYTGSGSQWE
ncbi:hypothetical protein HYDPIDRAFT_110846 [Hydnomerulius pinastri MD-312]|nr:hypothetical protein HYDPIDRAFT_110846 [Hydnomerulius pinastri MD-312]